MAIETRPKRRKSLSDALGGLSDGDFWSTRSAEPGRSPVATIVTEPTGTDAEVEDRRRAKPTRLPTARHEGEASGNGRGRAIEASEGPLLLLRPRNARRQVAMGRIAVRVPLEVMRRFNGVARLRGEPRGVLFQRVITGFLDRLERDGVDLIAELHKELGLGQALVVDDDVWAVSSQPTFSSDRTVSTDAMVQMAHAVEIDVARRFDDCSWRLQIAKDSLGRLIVSAFLLRFIVQRPELEQALGFTAFDVRASAGASLR